MREDKRFTIKIEGEVFYSDSEGLLNLNDIWNVCNLPKSKRPSQWRSQKVQVLKEKGCLQIKDSCVEGDNLISRYTVADEEAVILYAIWCQLSVESHGVSVVSMRDELWFGRLLVQIFPEVLTQHPYKDGKYFVDFYIPSLRLNIEYDELYHDTPEQKIKDAERELDIGGKFFRVKQGSEVDALLKLKTLAASAKRKDSSGWCVDGTYYFKDEMTAYKFCVSTEASGVTKVKLPKSLEETKFICTGCRFPMVYFPMLEVSGKPNFSADGMFSDPIPF